MANPRSLIYALYTHWDIIESLIPLSREFPVFEQQQLLTVITRIHPGKSLEEREDILVNSLPPICCKFCPVIPLYKFILWSWNSYVV